MTTELRCSPAIRGLGVDPIGSAPGGTSYLLVDLPMPWQRDVGDDPRLAELHATVDRLARAGHQWRVQATAPEGDERRVVAYRRPPGPARGFIGRSVPSAPDHEVASAIALLEEEGSAPGAVAADAPPVEDLLVCTHGARDVCCGGTGTSLWRELVASGGLPPGLRVSRTSHTGGHRFAPTAVHLPSGTCWAWLDAGVARAIVDRSGSVDDVLGHYRGSCLLPSPAQQLVERAAFAAIGWGWLDHLRWAEAELDGDSTAVVIRYQAPNGATGAFRGTAIRTGTTPVPECGRPLDEAPKSAPVVVLEGPVEHHQA